MTDKPLVVSTISPEEADKIFKRIQQLHSEIGIRVYEVGAFYEIIVTTKAWCFNWSSLNACIADLKCGRKTFFNYTRLYKIWKHKISRVIDRCPFAQSIPHTRILAIANHFEKAETDDEIITILHNAEVLSASDLAIAYGKRAVEFRGRGNLYRIIDQNTQLYDFTISSAKIHWGQADPQVYCREAAKLGWIVDFIVKIVNPEELRESQ